MNIIQWHFKEFANVSNFENNLFEAWMNASDYNRKRLETAFPEKFVKDKMTVNGTPFNEFTDYKSLEKEYKKIKFSIMHLTEEDICTFLSWGYLPQDIDRLQYCALKCELSLPYHKDRKISVKTAIANIGRTEWLSGIGRAAFHGSCYRQNEDGGYTVNFEYKN